MPSRLVLGILLTVVSAFGFGSGALFAKPVYAAGVGWHVLMAWRFLIGAIFAWGWVALSPVSDRCVYSGAVRSWASRPYILSTGRVTAPLPRQRSSMIWVGPHSSPGR